MNICLVSQDYPTAGMNGGIGTYLYNLAHSLSESGQNVHIITKACDDEKTYMDRKVMVHTARPIRIKGIWRLEKYFPILDLLYSLRVAQKLQELRKIYDIEIVEFANWRAEGFWYSFMTKTTPIITRLHTPYIINRRFDPCSFLNKRIRLWMEKKAVLMSNSLTASTASNRKIAAEAYNVESSKIKIISLGIRISNFNPVNSKITAKNKKINILYVSRLEKKKGARLLLQIIPRLITKYPHIHLNMVGYDHKSTYKRRFIKKHNGKFISNVHFFGYVNSNKLHELYKESDIFVVPSVYESFGLVYLEAMQYGKPVIACKNSGAAEIIEDKKNGLLISPNNRDELSKALIKLIENEDLRQKLGKAAREKVEIYFSSEKMAQKTLSIYKEAISSFSKQPLVPSPSHEVGIA
jgi:glycosyltransferase involved in cell wall biosynthesis